MDPTTQLVFKILAIACALVIARNAFRHKKYPPGPTGYPFIGNARDLPKDKPWVTFAEWSKQYGDMIFLNVYGQKWLVLNSFQLATDLLDKRGSIYSDRPVSQMREIVGIHERGVALLKYTDRLRSARKLFHKVMGTMSAFRRYDNIEEEECQRFLREVLSNPEGIHEHVNHFAACVIMRITYGYQIKKFPDPFVDLVHAEMDAFDKLITPGRFLVDMIPWLRYVPAWFPGGGFKVFAAKYRYILHRTVDEPYQWTTSRMQSEELASFVSDNASDEKGPEAQDNIKWAAYAMFSGGSDTSVISIQSFFLAMAKYPDIQARAQAEIDEVVGHDRLPSLKDRDRLPYVRAVVWEVLRWHSIAPQGIPHVLSQDDIYNGYFIPKGTHILPNLWFMLHDPTVYHNPYDFDPTRFLKTKETDTIERDPRSICFGFGRRICPGRVMAESSVFISCAMLLATFDIAQNTDEELKLDYYSSILCHLKPFTCSIKPRNAKAIELINRPLATEATSRIA